MARLFVELTGDALETAALGDLAGADDGVGAVASFAGKVRAGDGLTHLELQRHKVLTLQALERIAQEAARRFDLTRLVLFHRHGRLKVGDVIVFIAASAPHRKAALEAVTYVIDVVKTQAPFWKREWRGGAYRWIEPTDADHASASRWLETAE